MPTESSIYWSSVDSRRSITSSSGSGAGGRHYVDPWDLENYAYLRRHSVADVPRRTRRSSVTHERSLRDARAHSEYWYALSLLKEPEDDGSSYSQKLYCSPVKPTSNNCYYQEGIYEDERMDNAAPAPMPFPVYAPAFEISGSVPREERSLPHIIHTNDRYMMEPMPSSHIDLNTYGHLRIDYTNNWNSLHRRISK